MIMCAKNLQLISTASNLQQPKNKPSKYGRSSCGEYTTNDMEGPFLRLVYRFCAIKKIVHSRLPRKTTHLPQTKNSKIGPRQSYWKARWISGCFGKCPKCHESGKKNRKGHILRFLTPNAKESMEPSWRSGTLAVYQVPQKNSHNGRISIMIITILHYHCIGNIG